MARRPSRCYQCHVHTAPHTHPPRGNLTSRHWYSPHSLYLGNLCGNILFYIVRSIGLKIVWSLSSGRPTSGQHQRSGLSREGLLSPHSGRSVCFFSMFSIAAYALFTQTSFRNQCTRKIMLAEKVLKSSKKLLVSIKANVSNGLKYLNTLCWIIKMDYIIQTNR